MILFCWDGISKRYPLKSKNQIQHQGYRFNNPSGQSYTGNPDGQVRNNGFNNGSRFNNGQRFGNTPRFSSNSRSNNNSRFNNDSRNPSYRNRPNPSNSQQYSNNSRNGNNNYYRRYNEGLKCFKCGREGHITKDCRMPPTRVQIVDALVSETVPVQSQKNTNKPLLKNERPTKVRKVSKVIEEDDEPEGTLAIPKTAAINPSMVRILADSGADINIIPKAALSMEQWKSREESNIMFTSAYGNSVKFLLSSIALFEISNEVEIIILGHPYLGSMGSTTNCKNDIWSIQVSKKHQIRQYTQPTNIGLISELDDEFTRKGTKNEIKNWIMDFKTVYGIQIN
ncbi:hypothetical protein ACTFIZ_007630 [Dictyostelium cf. discoideum]